MPFRHPVALESAYKILNHGPTVLVSSAHDGRRNVMAASWSMPIDFSPPKVALVIDKNTLTRQLVEASGEFVLNVPSRKLAKATLMVGSSSGSTQDKFDAAGLSTQVASHVQAPLIDGCIGWLECRVIQEPHNQNTYDLFIAEVVAAYADARVFSHDRWHFDHDELRSIHYVAGGSFFTTGPAFGTEDDPVN